MASPASTLTALYFLNAEVVLWIGTLYVCRISESKGYYVALKGLQLNNEHYLKKAFDPMHRENMLQAALLRRNVYVVLFAIGILCIFIAGFSGWAELSILSLFLATLSLVVVSKYDTQVFFLRIIEEKAEAEEA